MDIPGVKLRSYRTILFALKSWLAFGLQRLHCTTYPSTSWEGPLSLYLLVLIFFSLSVFSCVWIVCVWIYEGLKCLNPSSITLPYSPRQGLSQAHGLPLWLVGHASLLWDILSPMSKAGITDGPPCPPGIYISSRQLNPRPLACMAAILMAEPSPQTLVLRF